VCSSDLVHWAMCPFEMKYKCIGKENEPSLVFETVVSHSRMCLHASVAFLGSFNDITISRNDAFVQRLASGAMSDVSYLLYDANGVPKLCRGAYLLSDNGYLKEGHFTCPFKQITNRQELLWSEWCESVRKDVECFYRNIKSRWRFFSNGIKYHKAEIIQYAFQTAAILHNMLLAYDGLIIECENGTEAYWSNLNPDDDEEENNDTIVVTPEDTTMVIRNEEDVMTQPCMSVKAVVNTYQLPAIAHKFMKGQTFTKHSFYELRSALVDHHGHQFGIGDLWWPKSLRGVGIKNKFEGFKTIENRANAELHKYLYHRESNLRCLDSNGQTYTSRVGDGLFSNVDIDEKTIVGYFFGEIINQSEVKKRQKKGKVGYMIQISSSVTLDCYDNYKKGLCILSYANSPKNCVSILNRSKQLRSNAVLTVHPRNKTAALKSIRKISAHEEIIYSYHSEYVFPPPEN